MELLTAYAEDLLIGDYLQDLDLFVVGLSYAAKELIVSCSRERDGYATTKLVMRYRYDKVEVVRHDLND